MTDNTITYLNGDFIPAPHAVVSVQDRGFRFGDGIFETIPIHHGVPYQWAFHMDRLLSGLNILYIPTPEMDWQKTCRDLLHRNQLQTGFLRINVSRGVGSKGYRPLPEPTPTIVIETIPKRDSQQPLSLWLSRYRKPPLESLPVNHKLSNGLNSTLALIEADQHDSNEALLLTHDYMLCETASGNVFWIKDNQLFTPSLETGCLNGATRHAVIRLHERPVESVHAPISDLKLADAVFLTNSNWGVTPVSSLQPNGWQWSTDHPMIHQLRKTYIKDIENYVTEHRSDW